MTLVFEEPHPAAFLAFIFVCWTKLEVVDDRISIYSENQFVHMADVFMRVSAKTILQANATSAGKATLTNDSGIGVYLDNPFNCHTTVKKTLILAEFVSAS